jgi:cytoskeletal protein CcmA (bactofilin family)
MATEWVRGRLRSATAGGITGFWRTLSRHLFGKLPCLGDRTPTMYYRPGAFTMSQSTEMSILGPSSRVTGRISGKGAIRVEGKLVGTVSVNGPVEVAEAASVQGDVSGESLDLSGSLVGNVSTTGAVVIRAGALLHGEVKGAEVAVEPGSRVSIRLDTPFELDI